VAAVAEGQPVTVAIRPEDLRISGDGPVGSSGTAGEQAVGEAVAEVVEYHGRVLHVEAVTAHGDRLHLTATRPVRPGDVLRLAAAPRRALVFPRQDPLPQEALLPEEAPMPEEAP
jgi:putative spermidine/putrescine transport system ATP-binding protein